MKQILTSYKHIFIPLIIVVPLVIYFLFSTNESKQATLFEPISPITIENQTEEADEQNEPILEDVFVDVKGAIQNPGVYKLQSGDRIIDAIQLAGGYVIDANTAIINHAQKVVDEMVIYVPKIGEEPSEVLEQLINASSANDSTKPNQNGKINLNTATLEQLTTLPGIGMSKAQAIIAYREENGRFQTKDDLKKVSGIGEKTFEKLKELIDV